MSVHLLPPPPLVIPDLIEKMDAAAVQVDLLKFPSLALGNSSIRNSRSVVVSSSDQLAACLRGFLLVLPSDSTTGPFEHNE